MQHKGHISPKVSFTYQNPNSYPLRSSSVQLLKSCIPRGESLPLPNSQKQQISKNIIHNNNFGDFSLHQRKRKHKIFQQSHFMKDQSISKSRRKSQTIYGDYQYNQLQKTPYKQTRSTKIQTQNDQELTIHKRVTDNQLKSMKLETTIQDLGIKKVKNWIDEKLNEKLSTVHLKKGEENLKQDINNEEITQKHQQISYLTIQVQRLKRCQKLNSENISLYKRLVSQLKTHSKHHKNPAILHNQKIPQKSQSRKIIEKETPINSLYDLKKAEIQSEKELISTQNQNEKDDAFFVHPNQQILSPQQLLIKNGKIETAQPPIQKGYSKQITFNNTKQMGVAKKHSRRMRMQIFPNMLQVKQHILYNQSKKQTISQIQTGNRLQQINNHLQRKMSRRSTSRPNKDSKGSSVHHTTKAEGSYLTNTKYQTFLY